MRFLICSLLIVSYATTFAATTSAAAPQKVALLVGVSDYFHKNIEDLSYAENDVLAVGDELQRLGFHINVLTGENATRRNVIRALEDLLDVASKMESDGIVFLMFSGHGQQFKTVSMAGGTNEETPFYCPRDAVPFNPKHHSLRGKKCKSSFSGIEPCVDEPRDRSAGPSQ